MRWFVVATLFGLSFASYMERMNLSVAAELMMPALSLTKSDLAVIFNSFLLGYAIFRYRPAGWEIGLARAWYWDYQHLPGEYSLF